MLSFLRNKAEAAANRASGNTDLLEGVCAVAALVAYADGEIEDEEIASALDAVKNHRTLAGFKSSQIEQTLDVMLKRAKTMSGRLALKREIAEVADRGNKELNEDIVAIAVDIAGADGEVEPAELKVLREVANSLRVSLADFGL